MLIGLLVEMRPHLLSAFLLSGALKSTKQGGSWSMSGSGGYSKRNCLQDRDNFHRSRAWQIVQHYNVLSQSCLWLQ